VRWRERGRQRTRRFATKREAEGFVGELARGHSPVGKNVTVAAWLAVWIRTHGPAWQAKTLDERSVCGDRFILPALGGVRLRELTRRDIREWRMDLLNVTTVKQANRAVRVLSAALSAAVEDELVGVNVCLKLRPLEAEDPEHRPAELWEVEGIRAAMTSARDRLAVSLMAYGGLRPGEMRSLRWDDVMEATIVVRRGERRSGSTKTGRKGTRSIPIIGPIREDLEELGRGVGLVCAPRIHENNWRNREWRTAKGLVGSTATPYNLRHTAASLWIAEGLTVLQVAERLGHSTPALTMSTYGHLFPEAQLVRGQSVEDAATQARVVALASIGEVVARNVQTARDRVDQAVAAVDAARTEGELAAARRERRAAKAHLRVLLQHPLAGE
jgi:integrase